RVFDEERHPRRSAVRPQNAKLKDRARPLRRRLGDEAKDLVESEVLVPTARVDAKAPTLEGEGPSAKPAGNRCGEAAEEQQRQGLSRPIREAGAREALRSSAA